MVLRSRAPPSNASVLETARYFSVFECDDGRACLIWKSDAHFERFVGGASSADGLSFEPSASLVLPADWSAARMTHNLALLRHGGEYVIVGGRDSTDTRCRLVVEDQGVGSI